MAEQYLVTSSDLTSVADAIRAKTGGTEQLSFPEGFNTAITSISTETATEPYVEYTLDEAGNMTGASLHGFITIPADMFKDRTTLATADLTNSPNLTSISENAFWGCTNLAPISLPDGITSIGNHAFYNCTNLALTSLPSGLTIIGDVAFSGCTNLDLTSLPSGVTSLGQYAFQSCKKLALTSLPDGLTSIKYGAFYNCANLAITSLPSSLTNVGSLAFFGCTSLTNIEIAAQTLGTKEDVGHFRYCDGLQKVWLRSTCTSISVSSAEEAPFAYCPDSLEIYAEPTEKPDGWSEYFNRTGNNGGVTATVVYGQTTCPW